MRNIKTPECNHKFTYEEGHDIDCYNDGQQTIVPFQFSPEEIEPLQKNDGMFYYSVLSGKQFSPMRIMVESPFFRFQSKDALFIFAYYDFLNPNDRIWIWNTVDRDVPEQFANHTKLYMRDRTVKPIGAGPDHIPSKGEFRFVVTDDGHRFIFKSMNIPEEDISDMTLIEREGPGMEVVMNIKPPKK